MTKPLPCDFCAELHGTPSHYRHIYGSEAPARIIHSSPHFVALPTLGQLFFGSLLVLPKIHCETFARAPRSALETLPDFLTPLLATARQHGNPIVFEHGALSCTGGSCGIYHAHIHIVPLPRAVDARVLLPEAGIEPLDLMAALAGLKASSRYLYAGTPEAVVIAHDQAVADLPSQVLRRRLAAHFDLEAPWDWRAYATPEAAVLDSIAAYERLECI